MIMRCNTAVVSFNSCSTNHTYPCYLALHMTISDTELGLDSEFCNRKSSGMKSGIHYTEPSYRQKITCNGFL